MIETTPTPGDDKHCAWFHLSKPRQPRPPHAGNSSVRWVVVGAGLTGLAAARQLALNFPSDAVFLVEAQQVGYGSSGRNSGFAIDLPHDISAPDYIGDLDVARMNLKMNLAAQEIIKNLVSQHQIDCQLSAAGKYQAVIEDKGLRVLEAYRRGLDKLGQAYEIIKADDLPQRIGTSCYRQALFTPGTILLQPAALVKGLAECLPPNVTLFEQTPITEVEYGDKTVLRHAKGSITADKLLLTNNAFASTFGFLKGRLLPVFTYASMTRRLTEEEQARLGGESSWGLIPADPFGSTLRRTPDHRLLVRNSFSFNPSGRSSDAFLRRVARRHRQSFDRRFPMLPEVEFEFTWGGAMCLSRNQMAHFGQLASNVYGALCCNGLGLTRGTITGTLLADWLAGQRNELIDFLLSAPGPSLNPPEPLLSIGVNLSLMWGQYRAGQEI